VTGKYSIPIGRFLKKHLDFHRRWRKAGFAKAEYFRLLRYPGGHLQPSTVTFGGHATHFSSPSWFLHSVQEIFIDEVYRFLPCRRDAVIIDCGANIGLSVIYFKSLCPESTILAFEPDPSLCEILTRNVHERGLTDVEVRNNAVWIDAARLGFNADGALGGRISEDQGAGRQIEVQAIRLRDFLNRRIDFLKMDVEGAEYAVLKDCRDRLTNVENLFVEYHVGSSEEQRLNEILSWLSDAGFRYYISESTQLQRHPFVSKGADVFEMQLNIWCYRTASRTSEAA
jgi:FkbM family methyltransferase